MCHDPSRAHLGSLRGDLSPHPLDRGVLAVLTKGPIEKGPSRAFLTWRASRDGSLEAAYLGACRVGYANARGLWWTSLVRPEGGVALGRAASPEAARAALADAVGVWVAAAGLCSLPSPAGDRTETVPSPSARRRGPRVL